MINQENLTAQQYSAWLVHTMTQMDDGPEFEQLQEQFNCLHEQLDFLQHCYDLPPYETRRSV